MNFVCADSLLLGNIEKMRFCEEFGGLLAARRLVGCTLVQVGSASVVRIFHFGGNSSTLWVETPPKSPKN
jgi:hypothetical protein